jgi:photosystem II stability/assembly factor-like uncharacterized protein
MTARLLVLTCLGLAAAPRQAFAGDPNSIDDASLNAVQFIDENEGWAVGDDGIILHTIDRGNHWDLQQAPTKAMLTSVQITTGMDGWIVGRRPTPFTVSTSGTLLGTSDRGIKWWPIDSPGQFTGLNKVRFMDADKGWVVGDASDRSPTGMWFTTDAGRSWANLKSGRQAGWLGAASLDFNNGVLVGQNGSLANLRAGMVKPATADVRPGAALRAAARSGSRTWVVGDRSQVLYSDDAGVSWARAKLPIPNELRNNCDLYGVAAVGDKVWIVGRPGSVVFHSPDGGTTWERQKTGYGMPLKAVHFPTEQVGFAVGAMGALFKTVDGGKEWTATWDPKIGRRAAALFINADLRDAPLAVVARYGADQGYYCVGLGMTCPDLDDDGPNAAFLPTRQADAFRRAGGVYAETRALFPLPRDQFGNPVESILANWDKRLEGTASAEYVRELAAAIRMYRPYIVVTESVSQGPTEGGVRGLTARMCAKAIAAAADPNAYPELESVLHLAPHKPAVVYATAPEGTKEPSLIVHAASDVGARLGQSYAEVADAALALAVDQYANVSPTTAFSMVQANVPEERIGKDLLSGLALRPGHEARRRLQQPRELTDVERRQMESRKNLMAIAEQGEEIVKPEQALGGLVGATKDLSPPMAAHVVFRYGRKHVEAGRWDLAASVFEHLAAKYPEQPITAEALRWLAAYQASGEARVRFSQKTAVGAMDGKIEAVKGQTVANVKAGATGLRNGRDLLRWQRQAFEYSRGLQTVAPHVWSEAGTQLLLAAIVRGTDQKEAVKRYYDSILAADPKSRFARVVQQERWMAYGKPEDPPPAMLIAAQVQSRPKLDGKLDDECWGGTPIHKLTSGDKGMDASHAATVRMRYDDKYLYIAAECKFADGGALKPNVEKRTRDGDTSLNDRIELMIDVDRDYMTAFRFRVDQTGQAAEDCWGDMTWNPKWYVATQADEKGYRVEMAVPLTEIVDDPSKVGSQTWAVNVQRVVPGVGVLATARPASVEMRPEGLMLMKFDGSRILAN